MGSEGLNMVLQTVHTAHLRQECHDSKFGIFDLSV